MEIAKIMAYVWTKRQVEEYLGYYQDIRTHHTWAYATFAVDAAFARSVLPPCLEPSPEPAVTVYFGAFMEWIKGTANRVNRDRACLIGINARHRGREGIYYLTAIEEDEVNVVTGRELWGMPKKIGDVDFFSDGEALYGIAERCGHRLVEMRARLGETRPVSDKDESEIYFELRGYFGPNGVGLSGAQLVVFENLTRTKSSQSLTDVQVKLSSSPFDPGPGTIPLGDALDAGQSGGETSYIIKEIVDLDGDGHDYTPYLLGRLYDDWPDVREKAGRVVG